MSFSVYKSRELSANSHLKYSYLATPQPSLSTYSKRQRQRLVDNMCRSGLKLGYVLGGMLPTESKRMFQPLNPGEEMDLYMGRGRGKDGSRVEGIV